PRRFDLEGRARSGPAVPGRLKNDRGRINRKIQASCAAMPAAGAAWAGEPTIAPRELTGEYRATARAAWPAGSLYELTGKDRPAAAATLPTTNAGLGPDACSVLLFCLTSRPMLRCIDVPRAVFVTYTN